MTPVMPLHRRRIRISKRAFFFVACALSALTSGGLIAGIGPLQAALVREGYFASLGAVAEVFTGGFQIMTVLTCAAGLANLTSPRRSLRGWIEGESELKAQTADKSQATSQPARSSCG